jgi:predicted GNAT family acetyltransferase
MQFQLAEQLTIYELKSVATPATDRGRLRVASQEDFELVARWWYAAHMDMFGKADADEDRKGAKDRLTDGDVFLWDDGGPVSMACKTRPTSHGICVGMVYTPPEGRCRGYATACVGELSRTLLESGWAFCSLFADVLNPISNSIYQKIGYRPIGNFNEYKFMEKE